MGGNGVEQLAGLEVRLVVFLIVELALVLVILGYFTLLERKVLGYGQVRKGPNKGVLWGLFQPLLDGVKLFMKRYWGLGVGGFGGLWMFPAGGLAITMFIWVWLGVFWGAYSMGAVVLFILLFGGFVGSCFFVRGYTSGGKYRRLGSVRRLAQVVTYEGVVVMGLLTVIIWSCSREEWGRLL